MFLSVHYLVFPRLIAHPSRRERPGVGVEQVHLVCVRAGDWRDRRERQKVCGPRRGHLRDGQSRAAAQHHRAQQGKAHNHQHDREP